MLIATATPAASTRSIRRTLKGLRAPLAAALVLAGAIGGFAPSSPASAAGQADVSVQILPNTTPILAGESTTWTINWQCSSVDPAIPTCDNVRITPELLTSTPAPGVNGLPAVFNFSGVGDKWFNNAFGGVLTARGPIPAGESGQITVTTGASNNQTANNTELNLKATITSSNVASGTDQTKAGVLVNSTPSIGIVKKFPAGSSVLDVPATFTIKPTIRGIAGTGVLDLIDWKLVDHVPAGAVFVSASAGGTFDPATNDVTWTTSIDGSTADHNHSAVADVSAVNNKAFTLDLKFPSTSFTVHDTVTNVATVSGHPINQPDNLLSATDQVTFGFGLANPGSIFTKSQLDTAPNNPMVLSKARTPAGKPTEGANASGLHWTTTVFNSGNVPIGGDVNDLMPCAISSPAAATPVCAAPGFHVTSFGFGYGLNLSTPAQTPTSISWVASDGTTGTHVLTAAEIAAHFFDVAVLGMPAGTELAQWTAHLPETLPVGQSSTIVVTGNLNANFPTQTYTMTNCASFKLLAGGVLGNSSLLQCPQEFFREAKTTLIPRKDTNDSSNFNVQPGGRINWVLEAQNVGETPTAPTFTDLLPAELEFDATVTPVAVLNVNTPPHAEVPYAVTVTPNFDNSGRTLLRFDPPAGFQVPTPVSTAYAQIKFSTKVKKGTLPGGYRNPLVIADLTQPFSCSNGSDALDKDNTLGLGKTFKACATTGFFLVAASANASATKTVQGDFDPALKAGVGSTGIGGSSLWHIDVGNDSNVTTLTNFVVYDILPHIGDTGVSQGQQTIARGSQFEPSLDAPVVTPGAAVQYSQSFNPCRPELIATGPVGCVDDWSSVFPGPGKTHALRFDTGATPLAIGEVQSLSYRMTVPTTALPGQVAWNSLSFAAVRDDTGAKLLGAEPPKVGIKVPGGTTTVTKVNDASPAAPVSGAGLELRQGSTVVAALPPTDAAGKTTSPVVLPGVYELVEVVTPDRHATAAPTAVTITDGANAAVTIVDARTATVTPVKTDGDGNPLPLVEFDLTNRLGAKTPFAPTDANGKTSLVLRLADGPFTLHESKTANSPYGFVPAADITFDLTGDLTIPVTNQFATGSFTMDKIDDAPTPAKVAGATVTVKDASAAVAFVGVTDANGSLGTNFLKPGVYVASETGTPANHATAAAQTFSVLPGRNTALTMIDPRTSVLSGLKTDPAGKPLAGAILAATGADGVSVTMPPTDASGRTSITVLNANSPFTVAETKAPTSSPYGFLLAAPQTVTVNGDTTLTFVDNWATGSLTSKKIDDLGAGVQGAALTITAADNTVAAVQASDATGNAGTLFLKPGSYTVSETTTPDHHATAAPQTVTIVAGQASTVTMVDDRTATVEAAKFDENHSPLGGAVLTLTDKSGFVRTMPPTDATTGLTSLVVRLADGPFVLHELSVPNSSMFGFLPVADQTINVTGDVHVDLTDPYATGSLTSNKVDDLGAGVPGAELTITAADNTVAGVQTSDATGNAGTLFLKPGTYTVTETGTPDHHATAAPQTVTIVAGQASTVTMVDDRIATLDVLKTDPAAAGQPDTIFTVTNNAGVINTMPPTDATGHTHIVVRLADGPFTLHELTPPKSPFGFVPAADQTVAVTGDVNVTVVNQWATGLVEFTKTGDDGKPVQGAEVTLTGADGTLTVLTTDKDGKASAFVAPGTLKASETKVPKGFLPAPDATITVTAGQVTKFGMVDPIAHPLVTITTFIAGQDANAGNGPTVKAGIQPVRMVVKNTGNTILRGLKVREARLAGITCPTETLAPGEEMVCTATVNAVAGQAIHLNATVTGDDGVEAVSAADPANANVEAPAPEPTTTTTTTTPDPGVKVHPTGVETDDSSDSSWSGILLGVAFVLLPVALIAASRRRKAPVA